MKLISVKLENFRQYYGSQELDFSTEVRRNATVIHGVNGAGKTSLFLAINWCLYGEDVDEVRELKEKKELYRLVSKEAVFRAQPLESIKTSVELVFTHDNEKFRVVRSLMTTKDNMEQIDCFQSEHTMQRARGREPWKMVSDSMRMGTMNSILPSNVRTYFFFDGEKIDNFAKPEAGDEVRYAIYNVLKLEVLERGAKHLADVAREYRSELKAVAIGEVHDLVEREEKARKEKAAAINRKEEVEREIKVAREHIEDIDRHLEQMQSARALQERRARVERDRRAQQDTIDQLVGHIRELATNGDVMVAEPAIRDALAVLNQKRERGEIPSNIRQQFIKDLLDRMECICGHCLEPDSPGYQRLMAMMNSSVPGSLEDDVLTTSGKLSELMGTIEAAKDNLNSAMRQRVQIQEAIDVLTEELLDLSEQLKDSPHEEISQLEEKRRNYHAGIDKLHLEQGRLDVTVESMTKEIERIEKDKEKADKDQTKVSLLMRKETLAQRAADAIEATQGKFADEMRQRIERKTQEIFKMLVWKESHFQNICLGPDYKLEVTDRYGSPARPDLSAGERQVLSLSFITAMARVSVEAAPLVEEGSPLVMDTPFGRLSSQHRNTITEHLPGLAHQLVLFVTDEELRDQALKNLKLRIGAEYRLNFNQETSCTTIEKE